MTIDWVIPCRYGEIHDNLATLVGAGIDTLWVPQFPGPIQVGAAVRLLATADELGPGKKHVARSVVRDPAGETFSDISGELEIAGTQLQTEWLNGVHMFTAIQFAAAEQGTYCFEYVVGESTKTIPIHVLPQQ